MNTLLILSIISVVIACYGVFFERITSQGQIMGWWLDYWAYQLAPADTAYWKARNEFEDNATKSYYDRTYAIENSYAYKLLGGCAFCHVAQLSLIFGLIFGVRWGLHENEAVWFIAKIAFSPIFAIAFTAVTTTVFRLINRTLN